jgi:hypothetical protein
VCAERRHNETIIAKHQRWATCEDNKAEARAKALKLQAAAHVRKAVKATTCVNEVPADDALPAGLLELVAEADAKAEAAAAMPPPATPLPAAKVAVEGSEDDKEADRLETVPSETDASDASSPSKKRPRTPSGEERLREAARDNDRDRVRALLAQNVAVNAVDWGGWTALMYSGSHNRPECAQLLLQHGADINHRDSDGWTALHAACFNGSERAAEALLRAGAESSAVDGDGRTPRQMAVASGFSNLAKLFAPGRFSPPGTVRQRSGSPGSERASISPLAPALVRKTSGGGRGRGTRTDGRGFGSGRGRGISRGRGEARAKRRRVL